MAKTAQNCSFAVLSEKSKDSGEEDDNLNFLLSVYDSLNNFYDAINRLDYIQNNFSGALRRLDLQTRKMKQINYKKGENK